MEPAGPTRIAGLDEAIARVRKATRADNQTLIDLMAHVPMEGTLVVATRRDPDFFALYEMQRGSADAFFYDDGSFAGMAAVLVRDGFLDGKAQKVGYLGDLRLRGTGRARRAFPAMFGHFFADHVRSTGCEDFVTGVLASNTLALASLTRRKKKRAAQPYYHLLCPYEMASVQLLWRRRPRLPGGLRVDVATVQDTGPLASFLAADHRQRPFGYRFDDGELEHRLAHWPGYALEDTLIARDDAGRIVGATTLWDPAPVKRYRVMRYAGAMKLTQAAMRVASPLLGCLPLPAVGEDFRTLYLTNLSITDDNPVVLRALLERAYGLGWRKRAHFLALPLYQGPGGGPDALAPALRGFVVQRLAFHLYGVTRSDVARTVWPAGRPAFEMALA